MKNIQITNENTIEITLTFTLNEKEQRGFAQWTDTEATKDEIEAYFDDLIEGNLQNFTDDLVEAPEATPTPIEKTISQDEFDEKYQPIQNDIDTNSSYDGTMFETYGAELDFVNYIAMTEPNRVWTIIDNDEPEINEGCPVICSGFHYVNRIGYIVTKNPMESDVDSIEVID